MNNLKTIIISLVAAVIVVGTTVAFYHPTPGTQIVRQEVVGGTSPETLSPYTRTNGLTTWYYSVPMNTALGSTSCSMALPPATTTAQVATAFFQTLGSTTPVAIGWASGPMATTTLLGSGTILANSNQMVMTGSSTMPMMILPPNLPGSQSYVNIKVGGGAAFTAAPRGTCTLEIVQVN